MSNSKPPLSDASVDAATHMVSLGLMSGTSCDGVDAALVKTNGQSVIEFIAAETYGYDTALRERLLHIAQNNASIDDVLSVERQMTEAHVAASQLLLDKTGLQPALIGFHGHTIRHQPRSEPCADQEVGESSQPGVASRLGLTLQIGDPNLLAERLGIPVVSDFRRRDIAAGGEGAPLVPLFHRELLRAVEKPTAVLNIGGVGNITWLGPNDTILAGDTGPGCGLLDAWISERTGAQFDENAELALAGRVHGNLVDEFVAQPYFQQPLPKSADRFQFQIENLQTLSTEDGAATLCEATVAAVERTIEYLPSPPKSLYVTGGGARNPFLFDLLRDRLLRRWSCQVATVESLGLRVDSMEAECFAWLAVRRLRGLPTTIPETTGCRVATCGGQITC